MYPIYSYGSPRFALGGTSVAFNSRQHAGQVRFEPAEEEMETLGGRLITVFRGWRAIITLRLYNLLEQDWADHLKLISIINHSKRSGQPLLLQPRFASGARLDLWVKLRGDFGHRELTTLNAGQEIELEFASVELLDEMPGIVNLPGYLLIGSNSYLLLDSAGSRLIIPEQAGDVAGGETIFS